MSIKDVIIKNKFQFNKKYGQNFISDLNLLGAIVADAGVTAEDTVLEIGVGAGALTACIAQKAKRVIGYEIDSHLAPVLAETLADYDNVEIIFEDFMEVDVSELREKLGEHFKVVANLPYYITTPVIMKLIENALGDSLTIMVQEEVAERLIAGADTVEYGAITAQVALNANVTLTRKVARHMFYPPPNVDSAVVRIDIVNKYPQEIVTLTKKVIKAAFAMRRKTLVNNLMQGLGLSRENAENVLTATGMPLNIRGETLNADNFVKLANNIFRGV
ncbi:MAG: ribosomal RNA small subunit methyltransferase A [Clostridia bacterium]|nr:ribosomal RNA small subunit methyltransferase A [Clostridia bacterium]